MILPAARDTPSRIPWRLKIRTAARAEELPGEVDANHRVPILKGHIDQIGIFLQAGVGHQNIQMAEGVEGLREQAFDIGLLGHIAANRKRSAAVGIDLRGESLSRCRLGVVVKHHRRACCGQGFGRSRANAGTGPGDQGHLLLQGNLHRPPTVL